MWMKTCTVNICGNAKQQPASCIATLGTGHAQVSGLHDDRYVLAYRRNIKEGNVGVGGDFEKWVGVGVLHATEHEDLPLGKVVAVIADGLRISPGSD